MIPLSKQQQQLQEIVQSTMLRSYTTKSSNKLSQSFNPNTLLGQSQSPTHKTNQSIGDKQQKKSTPLTGKHYQQELLKLMTSQKQLQTNKSASKQINKSDVHSQIKYINDTFKIDKVNSKRQLSQKQSTSPNYKMSENLITVIVHQENTQQKFIVDFNQTTGWLDDYLKKEFRKLSTTQMSSTGSQPNEVTKSQCGTGTEQTEQELVAFITIDKNLPLDYYLQQHEKTLEIFKNQTLNLQPFYGSPQNGKITLKDFIFVKCIGVGGFSRVYLVRKKENGKFYAMKLIDKEFILSNKKQGIVQNERDIMTVLDHPFIIKLEYAFESKNFIVFVLEFCSGGELFWQLRQVKRMKEEQARFYFIEICLAMYYLHSLSVVYRDIKPENILIDIDGHIRIADFGLSKPNMTEEDYAYSFCGSPEYMAPEMLLKVGHNVQVDHYCLGALLYELVTGLPPYYSRDTDQIYESILNEELTFPEKLKLSDEIKNLLTGLLCKQPAERLGSEGGLAELLTHVWFKDADLVGMLQKKIPPPFKPNQLKFNFDSNDLMKGELETREKLLGKTGLAQDIRIFKAFYFDAYEQKQMKIEQQKILKQHQNFVAKQQLILQQKYKQPPPKQSKPQSPQSIQRNTSNNQQQKQRLTPEQFQALQKRIKSQQSSMSGQQSIQISSIPSPSQNKMIGLKRIISQNNFFLDRQTTLPTGAGSRDHEYQSLLSNASTEHIIHKRVSSLKQKNKK